MATFNSIADEIAGALDRPFDEMFKQRVKQVMRNELARMIRQSINKNGIDKQLVQRYSVALEEVDRADTLYESGCTVMRTEDKIYKPVRFNSSEPFTYVGTNDIPFPYRHSVEHKRFAPFLSLTGKSVSYDYRNQYIYLYNGTRLKYLTIETVFEDMSSVAALDSEDAVANIRDTCMDDMAIPIAGDLIQAAKERILSGELSITDDRDKIKPGHIDNN